MDMMWYRIILIVVGTCLVLLGTFWPSTAERHTRYPWLDGATATKTTTWTGDTSASSSICKDR